MQLHIDWLTLSVKGLFNPSIASEHWKVEIHDYKSRVFNKIASISFDSKKIFTIEWSPCSTALKHDLINLKVENNILYETIWSEYVDLFEKEFNCYVTGVSRIDICRDFNTFDNDYHPSSFISDVAQRKVLKNGRNRFTTRQSIITPNGTVKNDFAIDKHTQQITDLKLVADAKKDGLCFNALSFGNGGSKKSIVLYNKTKEMREVKFKTWIFDTWKAQSLDLKEVWRLEVRIKPSGLKIVDTETGQIIPITYQSILNEKTIETLYNSVVSQNFAFKVNSSTESNKTRLKDVVLFTDNQHVPTKVLVLASAKSHGLAEKIHLNRLIKEFETGEYGDSLPAYIMNFVEKRALDAYYVKRHAKFEDLPLLDLDLIYSVKDDLPAHFRLKIEEMYNYKYKKESSLPIVEHTQTTFDHDFHRPIRH